MFDSPLSASAYEVLGVDPAADDEALRKAYRLRLRQTHPDTGGDAAVFIQVQRAWELVGTAEARAAYDRGPRLRRGRPRRSGRAGEPRRRPADTRPRARSFGQPGGWRRERYLDLIREWVGRGVTLDDPYDPALVRSAPRDLRRMLADALAEEATARVVSDLGHGLHRVARRGRAGARRNRRRQARPHRARPLRPVRRPVRGLRRTGAASAAASSPAMRCRALPSPSCSPACA